MSYTEELGLEYTGIYAHVRGPQGIILTAEMQEEAEKQIDHTNVHLLYDDNWYTIAQWGNAIVDSVYLERDTVERYFLSANGKVYSRIDGEIADELIDDSDDGPSDLLLMKAMAAIDGDLFAVGMARRAYRKPSGGKWTPIDQSCFVPRDRRTAAVGFNALAGRDAQHIVAVGYKGEIWHYDGANWHQESSPTNVTLTKVVTMDDGRFLITGLTGTLLLGSPGQWDVLDNTETRGDFWGATVFKGNAYVANYDGVFVLEAGGLRKVYPGKDVKYKTAFLSSNDEVIWSAGREDLASSVNGEDWTVTPSL